MSTLNDTTRHLPVALVGIALPSVLLALLLAVLVWLRHAANIRRLRDGTEPRIGKKTA